MGKKPVVVEGHGKRKKKSTCCACFLAIWVTLLVILAAGTLVGCFFLDKFTKDKLDMSLGECFGVFNGLYWASDKKMVDYGYTDADYDAFDTEIKHQLFLKEDADLDLTEAVKMFLSDDEEENDPVATALRRAGNDDNANDDTGNDDNTDSGTTDDTAGGTTDNTDDSADAGDTSDKLLNFISALFVRENMDYERLAAYERDHHGDYLFHLNDKQLAAFIDRTLAAISGEMDGASELLETAGLSSMSDALSVRQIKFVKREKTVLDENGVAGEKKQVTMADVTVQIKLSNIVKLAMQKYIPNGFLAGLAHFGIKAVIPNNLYITAGIGLTDNVGLDISLNRITGDKVDAAYKLIGGIAELTGSDFDLKAKLDKMATDSIAPLVDKIDDTADFETIENGTLTFDTYGALANMAVKGNEEAGEEKLTGEDVLFTFSRLATSAVPETQKEHDYSRWYVHTTGDDTGAKVYVADPADVTDDLKKVDYEREFMRELETKYCLNIKKPDGKEYTFAEIVEAFSGGGAEGQTLIDMIDMARFGQLTAGKTEQELRLRMTDKMLSAIVAHMLTSDGNVPNGIKLRVEQTAILSRTIDKVGHDVLDLRVALDYDEILAGMGSMGSLVKAFLPEQVVVGVQVDVSPALPEGVSRRNATLSYNSMTPEETAELFSIFDKLGVEGFNTDDLTAMIADSVNEMLDKMNEHLPLVFEPSDLVEHKEKGEKGYEDVPDDAIDVRLPSIYGLLEKQVFNEEGNEIAAADIKDVFDRLYDFDKDNATAADRVTLLKNGLSDAAEDYGALQTELENYYYLKTDRSTAIEDFDTLIGTLSTVNGEFDAARFDVEKLKHDARAADTLTPVMTAAELARLFVEKMDGGLSLNDAARFSVEGVSIDTSDDRYDATLKVLVLIEMEKIAGDNAKLVPVDRLFATLEVFITSDPNKLIQTEDGKTAYPTAFTVNRMNETEQANFLRMLDTFGRGSIDPDSIAEETGEMLYEQLAAMQNKLGDDLTFTDGGVQLPAFYRFLSKGMQLETGAGYGDTEDAVAENLKGALQGMYASAENTDSAYNYRMNELLRNPISAVAPAPALGSATYTDKEMGYIVQQGIENGGAATATLGTLRQLIAVPKSARSQAASNAATWLEGFKTLPSGVDNIALTLAVPMSDFTDGTKEGLAAALLPDTLYATVLLQYDGVAYTSADYFRINSMTAAQQAILLEIAHLNTFNVSEIAKTEQCAALLSRFQGATYASVAAGGDGIGQVTCALGGV